MDSRVVAIVKSEKITEPQQSSLKTHKVSALTDKLQRGSQTIRYQRIWLT